MYEENTTLTTCINLLGFFSAGWIFGYALRALVDYLKDRHKE